jgi:uncharacterized protein (DUF1800 family)
MIKLSANLTRGLSVLLAGVLAFGAQLSLAQAALAQKNKASQKAAPAKPAPAKSLTEEQKAIHLLNRIAFGPRPGDVERVRQMGWERYLEEQLHPERIADQVAEQKLQAIPSIHLTSAQLAEGYYPPPQLIQQLTREYQAKQKRNAPRDESETMTPPGQMRPGQPGAPEGDDQAQMRREIQVALRERGYKPAQQAIAELQQAKILRAVYSERQLQEVMADFWLNHFNVFANKGADRVMITAYERDTIRPHVFGKFEDLLRATAKSPAMLFYLDNWMSASPNAKLPERPLRFNNNRRIQQANRFGQINNRRLPNDPRGDRAQQEQMRQLAQQQRRNRGLNENYAREIMELHTLGVDGGYTQKDVQEVARCFTGWTIRQPRQGGDFYFAQFMHDDGEKVVLGKKIPAGGGMNDGEAVIKLLAHHPATAKFISTKLARKFVSDNPPPALIDRTAKVFLKTGGDIREVLRSILTSPEFWAAESYRAKIKTPFEMTVSAVRALGAETNGAPQFHRWIAQMGEPLFLAQPPTGYAETAETWVNTGALLQRMNFALALSANRIPGTRVPLRALAQGADPSQPSSVADHFLKLLLHGEVSPQTRATLDKSLGDPQIARNDAGGMNTDVAKVVGLILGSPEFQRQ